MNDYTCLKTIAKRPTLNTKRAGKKSCCRTLNRENLYTHLSPAGKKTALHPDDGGTSTEEQNNRRGNTSRHRQYNLLDGPSSYDESGTRTISSIPDELQLENNSHPVEIRPSKNPDRHESVERKTGTDKGNLGRAANGPLTCRPAIPGPTNS